MPEDDIPAGPEPRIDDGLDWRELGRFGPRASQSRPRARRDLGPGGSLVQDAERARRLRRPQRWDGVPIRAFALGAAAVVLVLLTAAVLAGWGWVAAVVVLLILAVGAVVGRRVVRRPTAEARLLSRAAAERRIAAELDPLAASGWVLLHDRVLPGGEHRVPHVAIGPAGVFVVAPLPDTGPLRLIGYPTDPADPADAGDVDEGDGRALYAGPLHLGLWLRTRRWELAQLEPAIAAAHEDTVWTGPTAAVAVHAPQMSWWRRLRADTEVPEMPYAWAGVEFRPLGALVDTLVGLPSTLDRSAVAALAAVVEKLCPPAGRPDQPHTLPASSSSPNRTP